ncbi:MULTISPECIES: SipW-dependent-type signal peptide-containing protein [Oscillospiraceae]|nr:hypothetical protein DXA02_09195 [Ruminococcus sp. AM54-1NS]RGG86077.1 hypothetical protein DWW71_14005 [Ruminococcus sp. AF16-50]RGH35487.1 hypothetical protein DW938_09035 [Ruminococcus sp. AM43-6]RGH90194.1 hypothetical protein DW733_10240 [Ruminococcus sp. AM28-13]RGI09742.1 hypothetical protein DXD23_10590 [Ruminococcus sp. TF12-2]RGI36932.1 hypothetical protein DXC00_06950 [Ruminococcus sp. OM07-17]
MVNSFICLLIASGTYAFFT